MGANAESRTWTSTDGRTIEAKVLTLDETGVTILRDRDRKKMKLTPEMLSPEDQEYILTLRAAESEEAAHLLAEAQRTKSLKEGPFADLITGKFVYSKTPEGMPFQLYGPEEAKGSERYPLVLALHGGASRGSEGEWSAGGAANTWIKGSFSEENPCFVVVPRCPADDSWRGPSADIAATLVKELIANLPIDVNRVYVTGSSLGGGGSWHQITEHQELYAGALILANPGRGANDVEKSQDFPIWQFHGEKDLSSPVQKARELAEAKESADSKNYQFTELLGEGHAISSLVYSREDVQNWLFSQRRDKKTNNSK